QRNGTQCDEGGPTTTWVRYMTVDCKWKHHVSGGAPEFTITRRQRHDVLIFCLENSSIRARQNKITYPAKSSHDERLANSFHDDGTCSTSSISRVRPISE